MCVEEEARLAEEGQDPSSGGTLQENGFISQLSSDHNNLGLKLCINYKVQKSAMNTLCC